MKQKAIIIGAGPAGLTAGLELLRQSQDYEVTILEQSSTAGGISRTVCHNGNRMDIGGHRFFSKDKRVEQWWSDLLPTQGAPSFDDKALGREKDLVPGGPDPEKTDEVMLLRRRISRIYYLNKFFDYPLTIKPQTFINMGLPRTVKAGFSYLDSCVKKRPENSLEDFYINRFGKVLYSMFFEGYTEKLWGRHPSQISADWGAQRVKGLSILAVVKDMFSKLLPQQNRQVETSLIEQFVYPKLGPGQLWEKAADEFRRLGGTLLYGADVTALSTEGERVCSVTYQIDGQMQTVAADCVFSSMPLCDLAKGMGEAVPADAARIAAGLPYRDFVTVGLEVPRLKLKNETKIKTLGNIVPDCWIYVQDTDVKLGRIQIFNNWSPYLVKDPANTVWMGLEYFCTEGDAFWNMSEEDCVAQAVNELKKMGVIAPDCPILDSHRERVKKAYPAYFDTYAEIDTLIAFLNRFTNLYFIGRNGQHRYNNMDHSMVTAFEAVKALLSGSNDKTALWHVNTETEYHEEAGK